MANILGISPGTRNIGICILKYNPATQHKPVVTGYMKSFQGKWTEQKMQEILQYLSHLLNETTIHTMAVKLLHPSRTSPQLHQLIKSIKQLVKQYSVKLRQFSLQEIQYKTGATKQLSKAIIMEYLIEKYPELLREFTKEKRNQNPYYIKLFEAIAVADITFEQQFL